MLATRNEFANEQVPNEGHERIKGLEHSSGLVSLALPHLLPNRFTSASLLIQKGEGRDDSGSQGSTLPERESQAHSTNLLPWRCMQSYG